MAEGLLLNRDFALTVGTIRIATRAIGSTAARPTLRVQFKVEKKKDRDPNAAEVSIYNLSQTHRQAFSTSKNAPPLRVVLEAGYAGNLHKVFVGDLSFAGHTRDGADWITKLQIMDGLGAMQNARMNESFEKGTKIADVINKAVQAIGLGAGNTLAKVQEGDFRGALSTYQNGFVAAGAAVDTLSTLAESAGFEWHVQDGQVEFMRNGEPADNQAVVLSAATGLIGSPEIGEKGAIKVRSLLLPGISVGRQVQIKAAGVAGGFFLVERAVHYGDTWGTEWYTEVEARAIG